MTTGSTPTDEQLLAALADRDVVALEVLYDRHHRLALGLAGRMLGDWQAAEDVVQDVFLVVWRRAALYRPERGAVKTWLLAMVHHRAVDRLRQRRTGGPMEPLEEQMEDHRAMPVEQQALAGIDAERIAAALDSLPAEQRETIELAYFGGQSQSEIATMQGIPLGTVKGRTRLALEKLRGLLGGRREDSI